ncbi:LTA synthase family protein [Helicobacter brantae]|uniref:Sulfatase n=1 Tax=Helicobacter brantae TaxID=375927 RepID=A0A3D8IYL7_9HELI|nr:LTA synthase family protein [Helicobacter brantae]RDU70362.1 sulfatase [Helicobacter brantae]
MKKTQFNLYILSNTLLFALLFLGVGVVARYMMISSFLPHDLPQEAHQSLVRLWKVGLLYDGRIVCSALIPFYLFGLLLTPFSQKLSPLFCKLSSYFLGLLGFLFPLVWLVNYYYFKTYHTQIDIFIFGLADDDTWAIAQIIFKDYPVFPILFGSLACGYLTYKLSAKKPFSTLSLPKALLILSNLIFLPLFVCGVRGSVISTPLLRAQSTVSNNPTINHLVPNPIIALSWAVSDYKKNASFFPVSQSEGERLATLALGSPQALYATTPTNDFLSQNPPHIILNLMESFGINLLSFDNPKDFDLLGEFRGHYKSDLVFERFLSSGNGTASSFSSLYLNSPTATISLSSVKRVKPTNNAFEPFIKAGYEVVFITGGSESWHEYGDYLRTLGISQVYDMNSIIDFFPQAKAFQSAYGIPDEYLYKTIERLLPTFKNPTLIITLTTSNHPPEIIPTHYKAYPIENSTALKGYLEDKHFPLVPLAFQYSNDSFGKFLTWLKHSTFADNTIVVATGDHRMRSLSSLGVQKSFMDFATPFYLYVPKPYLTHTQAHFNPQTLGSHKDIFPTLFALSLSNAKYLANGGVSLLHSNTHCNFAYNESLQADCLGVYVGGGVMHKWIAPLQISTTPIPAPKEKKEKFESYKDLQWWQIRARTKGVVNP